MLFPCVKQRLFRDNFNANSYIVIQVPTFIYPRMTLFPRYFIVAVLIFFSMLVYFSVLAFCLLFICGQWRREIGIILFSLIFLNLYTLYFFPAPFPLSLHNKVLLLSGIIDSPVEKKGRFNQFILKAKKCGQQQTKCTYRLLLNDYNKQYMLREGDELTIRAKVRGFRNYKNPGSQNYAALQHAKGFSGQGYLKEVITHIKSHLSYLATVRQIIKQQITKLYQQRFTQALMASLLLGDRQGLTHFPHRLS